MEITNEIDDIESLQLAENIEVSEFQKDEVVGEFKKKRELLEKTKIVKQTWSISEIYQKIKENKLILNPDYQRREIWDQEKKTAFIESLYMGIMIPPIYVVEIPGENLLDKTKYEVVDGKQRLTAILKFIDGELSLSERDLEYFADLFGKKKFSEIQEIEPERTKEMLSSVLDIYVITANSPEFTKYDIFARLNKGAERLQVNEIRRAIYRSSVLNYITEFVEMQLKDNMTNYKKVFSKNDITRYNDYGRFYRSIAFYMCSNLEECVVEGYNSRPRDMINSVLQDFQEKRATISEEVVIQILKNTFDIQLEYLKVKNLDYIIDCIAPFMTCEGINIIDLAKAVIEDDEINELLEKSASTTSFVNARLRRTKEIVEAMKNE